MKCYNCSRFSFKLDLVIFGSSEGIRTDTAVDFIILYAKFYIYKCRFTDNIPDLLLFLRDLKNRLVIEKLSAIRRNKDGQFQLRWYPYTELFNWKFSLSFYFIILYHTALFQGMFIMPFISIESWKYHSLRQEWIDLVQGCVCVCILKHMYRYIRGFWNACARVYEGDGEPRVWGCIHVWTRWMLSVNFL